MVVLSGSWWFSGVEEGEGGAGSRSTPAENALWSAEESTTARTAVSAATWSNTAPYSRQNLHDGRGGAQRALCVSASGGGGGMGGGGGLGYARLADGVDGRAARRAAHVNG